MTMAGLDRLELAGGDRLFLLDDRERDAPVVGIGAGRHDALEHLVGQRLVRHDGDIAQPELTIMADKALPYEVLKRVVATCTAADYGRISLAVIQKEKPVAAGELKPV